LDKVQLEELFKIMKSKEAKTLYGNVKHNWGLLESEKITVEIQDIYGGSVWRAHP